MKPRVFFPFLLAAAGLTALMLLTLGRLFPTLSNNFVIKAQKV